MTDNERKLLAKKLAEMDSNDRRRLMKRASLVKKTLRPVSRQRHVELDDDGDFAAPVRVRKSNSMDEALWLLVQEEPGTAVRSGPTAKVLSIGPRSCLVKLEGETYTCRVSPDLASKQKSELAVGDEVYLETKGVDRVVMGVAARRTKLSRPDAGNGSMERVIVANVDCVVIVVSVVAPPLHPRLVDRYLIAIQKGGARPAIAVNKIDLHESEEALRQDLRLLDPYRKMGVPVVECSAGQGLGKERLLEVLQGKQSAFVGHSGVGKSSLLNMLRPDLGLQVGDVSEGYGRGTHTTTRSTLWELPNDTRVIDTPGIRSFGLWKMDKEELPWYFPDFLEAGRCRFSDCRHLQEPGCAVKAAVDNGTLAAERYDTYLRILATL
ncbi:MAG: ribosome small subunit-dependent GTPase A [Armatimonadetes bacterium]|nr:ribosome small subunit-dependent GTPase A [Armatimonadota bacterium]